MVHGSAGGMFRAPSPACAELRLLGASVLATTLRRHLRRHTGRMPLTKEVVKFGSFVVTNQVRRACAAAVVVADQDDAQLKLTLYRSST